MCFVVECSSIFMTVPRRIVCTDPARSILVGVDLAAQAVVGRIEIPAIFHADHTFHRNSSGQVLRWAWAIAIYSCSRRAP